MNQSKGAFQDSDDAYDPHRLWQGFGSNDSLPYETVLEGFTRYLAHTIRWSWDDQTPVQHAYYLARDEGLRAYCRHAATVRLGMQPPPSYTHVQFKELIFFEQMRKGAREAMAASSRGSLFEQVHKILLKRKLPVGDMGRWVFCLLWDRAIIPLEFWSYPATECFLATKLRARNAVPNEQRLRKWASRMKLVHAYSVVTDFNSRVGIPERGFNAEAFRLSGIPTPPEAALQIHNSA